MAFVNTDLQGLPSFQRLEWSYFSDLCAVIPADNNVHFFDSRGVELYRDTLKRGGRAMQISWSPISPVLAVGWSDGTISLWSNGRRSNYGPFVASISSSPHVSR
jgi:intraflagellar transport protein 140